VNSILKKFEIDGEDFRRLGIQDHEWRPSVIRQAASRSARGLARRLLKQKSPQAIDQLSQVSLTTYRLLDPRRRVDAAARAHIGRILPQTLSAADSSSFIAALNSGTPVDFPFGPDSEPQVISVESIEMVGEDTELLLAAMKWSDKLQHDDILRSGPRLRQWQKLSRRWFIPGVFVASMLVGGWLGLRSLDRLPSLQNEPQPRAKADAETSANLTSPTPADRNSSLVERSIDVSAAEIASSTFRQSRTEPSIATIVTSSMTPTSEVETVESEIDETTVAKSVTRMIDRDRVSRLEIKVESASISQPNLETDPTMAERQPVPTPDQYDQAKKTYVERYGDDSPVETLAAARLRIEAAWAAQLDSDLTIRYLASHQSVRWSWWIEPAATIHDRINTFSQQYEIEYADILAQSYQATLDRTRLPEVGKIVLAHLPAVVDRLSTEGRFEEVSAVLDRAQEIADLLYDIDCRSFIEDFRKVNSKNLRMKQSCVKYLISEETLPTTIDDADASVYGRYRCLVLRQWDRGLPMLTEASDDRIAGIARAELGASKIGTLPHDGTTIIDVESMIQIAKRWQVAAKKSRDAHESESMRLHSLDLLRSSKESASQLQKVEIARLIASVADQMNISSENRLGSISR
jgi:hypothetical protein